MAIQNSNIPPSFVNEVVKIVEDETIVRSNLKSVSDVYSWIEEYRRTSDTKWNLQTSRPIGTRLVCCCFFFFPLDKSIFSIAHVKLLEFGVSVGATDYVYLIDRQAFYVTPPTVLRHISSRELLKMIQDDVPMDGRDFIKFPSHPQAVELIVKLVTEACRKRVGPQNRYGFIRATLESRKQMSQFESKKDYKK
ncbi:hypothetical protein AVEN_2722-1 [Araneus ventricosus]|uniref:Uncharacterized protein n=1 Tax=Araneus ventricosus TaxID=182803 RepID=A0A4Y2KAM9_ARAVE|nr:hypothetical protein AVEN_2722-1 [Araneus ventricosus]